MMNQELTLGILSFNQGKFVDQLLGSIAEQTQSDVPLLIIDNASTDGSAEIIRSSLKKYVLTERTTFIQNEVNTGSAAGLSQLLTNSKTPFLSVIHGDDMLDRDYVESVLEMIGMESDFGAINVALKAIPNSSSTRIVKNIYRPLWTRSSLFNKLLVCGLNPGVMPGSVLNRNFIISHNLLNFERTINGVEDTLLWMRIIRAGGTILSLHRSCYFYRIHQNQFSYEDDRNSFYYGYARRLVIDESQNMFEKILSRAEISYELKRFGKFSAYSQGLGSEEVSKSRTYMSFRFFNILIRRLALLKLKSVTNISSL
jgi:glycosyltransferase EpsH